MSSSFLRESNESDDAKFTFLDTDERTGRTLKYNDSFFQIMLDESMKMKMIVFYKCVQCNLRRGFI